MKNSLACAVVLVALTASGWSSASTEAVRVAYESSGDGASVQHPWGGWTRNGTLTRTGAVSRPIKQAANTSSTVVPAKKASTSVVPARRITTEQEYLDTLVGKTLSNKQGSVVARADGTYAGKFGKKKLKGKWTWEGKYFCRTGVFGKKRLEPDCQTVVVSGDKVTFTRKKGKGNKSTWRIE